MLSGYDGVRTSVLALFYAIAKKKPEMNPANITPLYLQDLHKFLRPVKNQV